MVKIEDVLVRTEDEWLSSGQDPLPVCSWGYLLINWLRKILIFQLGQR